MDYAKGTSKGFAFVEFEEAEDATEAIFNRNGGTLLGRTLQVSMAQANQANKLTEPVWNSDEWFQKNNNQQQQPEQQQPDDDRVVGANK
jgi:RNA recognition motif-containing protein